MYKPFDPKTLGSVRMLELKLNNMEINKEDKIGQEGKDNYVVDLIFENVFYKNVLSKDDYNDDIEKHFDLIYNTVLEETGIYLENIEIIDNEEIHAWGIIFKEDDKYYVSMSDNTEIQIQSR
jgi:hypothetical protein